MSIPLNIRQRTGRVISDLILGLPILLQNGPTNLLVAAAETLRDPVFGALSNQSPHLAITARRAAVLNAMVYDGRLTRIKPPSDANCAWVQAMADPSRDLAYPMKGPFAYKREGDATLEQIGIELCKLARLLPCVLCVSAPDAALTQDLTTLQARDFAEFAQDASLREVVAARVPLAVADATQVRIFGQGSDFEEHYAVVIGTPDPSKPVLCRLHSACFTGDVLGSRKCDCGAQLNAALGRIADERAGILLYLNQEGRGIGLANKLRAYSLQDQGYDTVEANHRLGFEDDERDLQLGAQMLSEMGFSQARLMTNNPSKVERMSAAGIEVTERVPHQYGAHEGNAHYLKTKADKSGHLL